MKIIHTEASWGWGGQELRILIESAEFIKNGHDVTIVADPRSTVAQRAADFGVPVVQTTLRAKRLPDLIALYVTLSRLKPEVVVCHSSTDHWLTALARLVLKEKPTIVRARHVSAEINRLITTKWLYKNGCEGCLTTSTSIKTAMIRQKLGTESDIVCIPTGTAPPSDLKARHLTRASLDISSDQFVISIVATLRSWKGHSDLLEALALSRLSDVIVLIAGDGPQREALEKLSHELQVSSQVLFLGHREDVYDILDASDAFALPSFANEGVPQAILQAMAIGLPIVSCPIGGIPEALEGYEAKWIVPPKSPRLLAAALKALKSKYDCDDNFGASRRSPMLKYGKEEMYEKCLKLYISSVERFESLQTQANESHGQ